VGQRAGGGGHVLRRSLRSLRIPVHERVGGEIVDAASEAMHVTGLDSDWDVWTDMSFPETGSYVVPHALTPVEIDRERDIGEYREPACWMRHRIENGRADAPARSISKPLLA
jgi:hypothetical protein